MKNTLTAIALMCAATAASAQMTTGMNSNVAATTSAQNAGNSQNIISTSPGTETIRSAPTVYAPNPITPYSQASCIYSVPGSFSIVAFGLGGAVPVDGLTCNWRLSTQGIQATAAGLRDLAVAYHAVAVADIESPQRLLQKSQVLMDVASNMECLTSDRQRMVMEKMGLCKDVADVATLDHRFNQPRSTQIDYSAK